MNYLILWSSYGICSGVFWDFLKHTMRTVPSKIIQLYIIMTVLSLGMSHFSITKLFGVNLAWKKI